MAITTEQIKELRDRTGISMMQVKKALEEAGGDTEKAVDILKKVGAAVAAKKADRTLGAGVVESYIHNTKEVGSMVVLSCETDFVAKNEEFVALARDIAMHITATNPEFLCEDDIKEGGDSDSVLLNQPFIKDSGKTVNDLIESAIQKFGERIEITTFVRFSVK
ncbi:elongation factor Ts [bacterium]|nr:elongation factor Ts [bacterium]|tara:strand:- start:35609 stop:36100 length:492 start_codon:yes stop_codon:yes gene_type:complete